MTDIKEQKYCDICGSPEVWCMCDNSIGEPTIQSLASALTIAKMTVAYQRELILKLSKPSPSNVSVTQDVLMDIKTGRSVENTNPDYYKAAEKTALVRLCGVLGVLTENNDLATAALLAATRIESLEKKIPALNVDLAEASMHAYNGEVSRMNLEAELARHDEIISRLKEDAERLASNYVIEAFPHEWVCRGGCHHWARFGEQIDHAPDCPVTLHRALMKELE